MQILLLPLAKILPIEESQIAFHLNDFHKTKAPKTLKMPRVEVGKRVVFFAK